MHFARIRRWRQAALAGGALVVVLAALIAACGGDGGGAPAASPAPERTALAYREVQCHGNPWERDWLASHSGQPYPANEQAQQAIFEAYWSAQGIDVSEVRRAQYLSPGDIVCLGCDCPTGLEWRVRVPPDDEAAALSRGFRPPS